MPDNKAKTARKIMSTGDYLNKESSVIYSSVTFSILSIP